MGVKNLVCRVYLSCLMSLVLCGCRDSTRTTSQPPIKTVTQREQGEKVTTEPDVPKSKETTAQEKVEEPTAGIAENQVVCNKFKLVTEVANSTLHLSVDTDLPDNTTVMVGVSRSYLETGKPDRYSVDYFSERSTIGKWRSKNRISIASEKWKSALKNKQERLSGVGLGFDVASISDKIRVSMVVPINQPDPRFGERNKNLTGKAVTMASKGGRTIAGEVVGPMYVVEDEIKIDYPLDSPPVGRSPFPSLNPLQLEVGQAYIVSKQTPLMPSLSPADPMAAIQRMRQIPKGGVFKVLETAKKRNTPWYRVVAFNEEKQRIGTGWINSTALLGQRLKAPK